MKQNGSQNRWSNCYRLAATQQLSNSQQHQYHWRLAGVYAIAMPWCNYPSLITDVLHTTWLVDIPAHDWSCITPAFNIHQNLKSCLHSRTWADLLWSSVNDTLTEEGKHWLNKYIKHGQYHKLITTYFSFSVKAKYGKSLAYCHSQFMHKMHKCVRNKQYYDINHVWCISSVVSVDVSFTELLGKSAGLRNTLCTHRYIERSKNNMHS